MHTDDLCKLPETTEKSLLDTLEYRYRTNRIYTNAGIVLISINPYTPLDIYGTNVMNAYFNTFTSESNTCGSTDPHIYGICESSYQDMHNSNQTIMISGESGSGKTENTKYLQEYLITRTNTNNKLKIKIDALTVILESFGNAQTVLNDNSSRVGKMITYYIDGDIKGIKVNTFLLEKSRVTHQSPGESNFNVFYQLCEYKKMTVVNEYINTKRNPGKNNEKYKIIKEALYSLEFNDIKFIEDILIAVLYFGYVKFISIDGIVNINEESLEYLEIISKTLEVERGHLEDILLKKEIRVGNEILIRHNTLDEASTIRDSIARLLYVGIFEYIVDHININMKCSASSCINILDIFGFEIFKKNSLDQLCINYANEKIQSDFIKKIFEEKQAEYQREISDYKYVPYNDNKYVISEFERRCGLFDLIDEESKNKFGTTDNLRNKIGSYISREIRVKSNEKIVVKHYVKDVEYDLNEFIRKNKEVAIDRKIFSTLYRSGFSKRGGTVISSFLGSLCDLFSIINSTQVKYIRCIKPNDTKSNIFDREVVYNQLLSTGILEVIKISKQIFTYEMDKEEWFKKYGTYKWVLEGKTKVYFDSRVKRGIEACEWRQNERKRRVLEWFMAKLVEKKEGINKLFENDQVEPKEMEFCDIEMSKKERIKFVDVENKEKKENSEYKNESDKGSIMNREFEVNDPLLENNVLENEEVQNIEISQKLQSMEDMISDLFGDVEENNERSNLSVNYVKDCDTANSERILDIELINVAEDQWKNVISTEESLSENIESLDMNVIPLIDNIPHSVDQIPHSVDNIPHSVDQIPHSVDQIPHSVDNIPHSVDQIPHSVDQIPHSVDQIPHSVDNTEQKEIKEGHRNEIYIDIDQIVDENIKLNQETCALKDEKEIRNIDLPLEMQEVMHAPNEFYTKNKESACSNCSTLQLKYKFVSEALKEANQRLSTIDQCPSTQNTPYLVNASNLFARLFHLYLENIPSFGSDDIPKSEMLSYAHSAYLVTIRVNKNIKESVCIFTEELSLRLKYFEKNMCHLIFFLSNLIEYRKLVGTRIDDLDELISTLFVYMCDMQKVSLTEYIPFSITEHQELLNFRCSDSFIKKIFKPVSIYKLIKALEYTSNQMDYYHLDRDYKNESINHILDIINVGVFNSLLVKKNFLNFNRCIQINYNINQIYKWLNDIGYVQGMNNIQHIMGVIKLVNMSSAKCKGEMIRDQCKILSSEQIKTFLRKMDCNEYEIEDDGRKEVFISSKPVEIIKIQGKEEENFVVPRYIPTEELYFLFK
jgi:myosin heavy subunit